MRQTVVKNPNFNKSFDEPVQPKLVTGETKWSSATIGCTGKRIVPEEADL